MGIFNFFSKEEAYIDNRKIEIIENDSLKEVTVDYYVKNILNNKISENFNNVENLYNIIIDTYEYDIYLPLESAVNRLYELEKSERVLAVKSKFLLYIGDYDQIINMYSKYLKNIDDEYVSYSTNYMLAQAYDFKNDERALLEYKKAINKFDKKDEMIEKYINCASRITKENKLNILEDLYKTTTNFRVKTIFLKKIYIEIEKGNISLEKYKDYILNIVLESLNSRGVTIDFLVNASEILLDLKLYKDFEEILLGICVENLNNYSVLKQVLNYYLFSKNYEKGLFYISKLDILKYKDNELRDIINYENKFIGKLPKFINNIDNYKYKTYNEPILYKNVKSELKKVNKNTNGKHLFFIPISSYNIESKKIEKYIDNLYSIQSYLLDLFHYNENINVKSAIFFKNNFLELPNIDYSKDYLKLLASKNLIVNNIVYGKVSEINGMLELNMYIYDTETKKDILIANNYLKEKNNDFIIENILKGLERYLEVEIEKINYDFTEEMYNKLVLYLDNNISDYNKYRILTIKYIIENLKIKILKETNSKIKGRYILKIISLLYIISGYAPDYVDNIVKELEKISIGE